jgi:hypothetical protein
MSKVQYNAYNEKPHYNRRRKIDLASGEVIDSMTTRYAAGWGTRIGKPGPRGGKRYEHFPHFSYWHEGRFYSRTSVLTDSHTWANYYEPYTGTLDDAHPKQSAKQGIPTLCIVCEDGLPEYAYTVDVKHTDTCHGSTTTSERRIVWDASQPVEMLLDIAQIPA